MARSDDDADCGHQSLFQTAHGLVGSVVGLCRGDLGISDVGIGLLMGTAFSVIYGLAGIPLGVLADRTSRRNLLVAGMLVWSVATVYCGFARTFVQVFAGRVAVGLLTRRARESRRNSRATGYGRPSCRSVLPGSVTA
jgi:MFS family permease